MKKCRFMFPVTAIFCLLLTLCLVLTGCSGVKKEPLTKENLAEKRIGVILGYSTDYILTDSDWNLDIYRYDTYADMQLALRFNRIDAVAMEMDEAYVFCRIEPDFEIALVAKSQLEYAYMFSSDRPELLGEFNKFIREFKKTGEYADMLRRVKACAEAPFVAKKVKNTATADKVLKVAAFDGWEPVSYINTQTGEWEGCDIELITHFANHIGAKLELRDMSWDQMRIEIGMGTIDLILCPDSLLLAKDLEMNGNITMSNPVFLKDIVFIVNKEEK